MVSKSDRSAYIERCIEEILRDDRSAEFESIDSRECGSDRFNGVQLTITGEWIPARPIIDFLTEQDGYAIETLAHRNDGKTGLSIFIAYLPTQDHPAFV